MHPVHEVEEQTDNTKPASSVKSIAALLTRSPASGFTVGSTPMRTLMRVARSGLPSMLDPSELAALNTLSNAAPAAPKVAPVVQAVAAAAPAAAKVAPVVQAAAAAAPAAAPAVAPVAAAAPQVAAAARAAAPAAAEVPLQLPDLSAVKLPDLSAVANMLPTDLPAAPQVNPLLVSAAFWTAIPIAAFLFAKTVENAGKTVKKQAMVDGMPVSGKSAPQLMAEFFQENDLPMADNVNGVFGSKEPEQRAKRPTPRAPSAPSPGLMNSFSSFSGMFKDPDAEFSQFDGLDEDKRALLRRVGDLENQAGILADRKEQIAGLRQEQEEALNTVATEASAIKKAVSAWLEEMEEACEVGDDAACELAEEEAAKRAWVARQTAQSLDAASTAVQGRRDLMWEDEYDQKSPWLDKLDASMRSNVAQAMDDDKIELLRKVDDLVQKAQQSEAGGAVASDAAQISDAVSKWLSEVEEACETGDDEACDVMEESQAEQQWAKGDAPSWNSAMASVRGRREEMRNEGQARYLDRLEDTMMDQAPVAVAAPYETVPGELPPVAAPAPAPRSFAGRSFSGKSFSGRSSRGGEQASVSKSSFSQYMAKRQGKP